MPYYCIMRIVYCIQISFRKNSVLPYLTNAIYTYPQMVLTVRSWNYRIIQVGRALRRSLYKVLLQAGSTVASDQVAQGLSRQVLKPPRVENAIHAVHFTSSQQGGRQIGNLCSWLNKHSVRGETGGMLGIIAASKHPSKSKKITFKKVTVSTITTPCYKSIFLFKKKYLLIYKNLLKYWLWSNKKKEVYARTIQSTSFSPCSPWSGHWNNFNP